MVFLKTIDSIDRPIDSSITYRTSYFYIPNYDSPDPLPAPEVFFLNNWWFKFCKFDYVFFSLTVVWECPTLFYITCETILFQFRKNMLTSWWTIDTTSAWWHFLHCGLVRIARTVPVIVFINILNSDFTWTLVQNCCRKLSITNVAVTRDRNWLLHVRQSDHRR